MFLFPENMIWHLRRKMKDDLSQKKYTEIWHFLQTFLKDGLFKKGHAGTWSFLYYLEKLYFFSKTWYFFLGQEVRDELSQEIHGNMIFSGCSRYRCYKRSVTPLCQKSQRWSYPAKIHLKVIDVVDWHPRKSPSNCPYFRWDLYRRFHVLLFSGKNQET